MALPMALHVLHSRLDWRFRPSFIGCRSRWHRADESLVSPEAARFARGMGVGNLHNFVSSIAEKDYSLSSLANQMVAVDASAWLFKGLYICPLEIAQGQATDRFLEMPLRLLEVLTKHHIKPYFVFDGAMLPMKAERAAREGGRRHQRESAFEKAVEALRAEGATSRATALCSKAASVLPWMATRLIDELRRRDVPFVVAPYEADPQIAYLVRERICACAISEDSDLLAYGCPCSLFKLEVQTALGTLVTFRDLRAAVDAKGVHLFDSAGGEEWASWSEDGKFVDLCILAGTDYLPALKGVGIKTAHAALKRSSGLEESLRVPPLSSMVSKAFDSPSDSHAYLVQAAKVRSVFRHALVYDPRAGAVVPLNPLPRGAQLPSHLGKVFDVETARRVCADASLDPQTLQPRLRDPTPTPQTRAIAAAMQEFDRRRAAASAFQAISQLPESQEGELPAESNSAEGVEEARRGLTAASGRDDEEAGGEGDAADIAALAAQANALEPESEVAGESNAALAAVAEPISSSTEPPDSYQPPPSGGSASYEDMPHDIMEPEVEEEDDMERERITRLAAESATRGHIAELHAHLRNAEMVRSLFSRADRQPHVAPNGCLWLLYLHLTDLLLDGAPEVGKMEVGKMEVGKMDGVPENPRVAATSASHASSRPARRPLARRPPTSAECQRALKPALVFLTRLSSWVAQAAAKDDTSQRNGGALSASEWTAAERSLLRDSLVSCWRQALIEPLRASDGHYDWESFLARVRALPAEVAGALRAELEQLRQMTASSGKDGEQGGQGSRTVRSSQIKQQPRLCECTPAAVGGLSATHCDAPHTCHDVRRRVQAYVVRHPPSELATPLRKLLEIASRLLPTPALADPALSENLMELGEADGEESMGQRWHQEKGHADRRSTKGRPGAVSKRRLGGADDLPAAIAVADEQDEDDQHARPRPRRSPRAR